MTKSKQFKHYLNVSWHFKKNQPQEHQTMQGDINWTEMPAWTTTTTVLASGQETDNEETDGPQWEG